MMSCEKQTFPYSFFIRLTQWHEFPVPKLTHFYVFIIPLPLNVTLFSKSPYLTAHIKINYEAGCIGSFRKKYRDISRTIVIAKMELFVALVSGF